MKNVYHSKKFLKFLAISVAYNLKASSGETWCGAVPQSNVALMQATLASLRHREKPGSALHQVLEGGSLGLMAALAIVQIAMLLGESMAT